MSWLVRSLLARLLLFANTQMCIGLVNFCPPVARVGSEYRLECSFPYNNSWRNYNWMVRDRKHGSYWSSLASCHDLKCTNSTPRASAEVIVGDGRFTRSSLLLHNLTAEDSGSVIRCESWNQEAMSLHRHVVCRLDVRDITEATTLKEGYDYQDLEETRTPTSDSTTRDLDSRIHDSYSTTHDFDKTAHDLDFQANPTNATLRRPTTTHASNDSERNSTNRPVHHSTLTIDSNPSANQLTFPNDDQVKLTHTYDDQVKLTALSMVESSTVHLKDIFIYCALAAIFCLLVFIVFVVIRRNKNSSNRSRPHDQSPAYRSTDIYRTHHSYESLHSTEYPSEVLPPPPNPHRQQHICTEPVSSTSTASIEDLTPLNHQNTRTTSCQQLDNLVNNPISSTCQQLDSPDNESVQMVDLDTIYIDTNIDVNSSINS